MYLVQGNFKSSMGLPDSGGLTSLHRSELGDAEGPLAAVKVLPYHSSADWCPLKICAWVEFPWRPRSCPFQSTPRFKEPPPSDQRPAGLMWSLNREQNWSIRYLGCRAARLTAGRSCWAVLPKCAQGETNRYGTSRGVYLYFTHWALPSHLHPTRQHGGQVGSAV